MTKEEYNQLIANIPKPQEIPKYESGGNQQIINKLKEAK